MKHAILVFIGGGFGSVLRFVIGKYLNNTETGIPYGTFLANILGSLLQDIYNDCGWAIIALPPASCISFIASGRSKDFFST